MVACWIFKGVWLHVEHSHKSQKSVNIRTKIQNAFFWHLGWCASKQNYSLINLWYTLGHLYLYIYIVYVLRPSAWGCVSLMFFNNAKTYYKCNVNINIFYLFFRKHRKSVHFGINFFGNLFLYKLLLFKHVFCSSLTT